MREKQILARAIEIHKENWGSPRTFRHKQQLFQKAVKYKVMYGVFFFFQIQALLSLKNAWLPPIFFLDTESTC